jgi:CDP-diacylglycerol--inositol 3-phosphatidyltransferase
MGLSLIQFFYLPQFIDYARIYFLYLGYVQCSVNPWAFAGWYTLSYLLDALDGPAARAFGQESHLGYYLDMIIDRVSSCLCLHLAAVAVAERGVPHADIIVPLLYAVLVVVEVISHAAVVIASEFLGVHQKFMGHDWTLVRLYLGSKARLFYACASFEALCLSVIVGVEWWVVAACLPGFVFRCLANVSRLLAMSVSAVMGGAESKGKETEDAKVK